MYLSRKRRDFTNISRSSCKLQLFYNLNQTCTWWTYFSKTPLCKISWESVHGNPYGPTRRKCQLRLAIALQKHLKSLLMSHNTLKHKPFFKSRTWYEAPFNRSATYSRNFIRPISTNKYYIHSTLFNTDYTQMPCLITMQTSDLGQRDEYSLPSSLLQSFL